MEATVNEDATTPQLGFGSTSVSRRRAFSRLGSGALVFGVLAGTLREMARAQATPTADEMEAVARQAIDAVNDALASGDTSALDAVFAPEVQGHPSHRSLVTGEPFSHDLVGLKAALADIRRFFPDAAITIDGLISSGETVAARVRFRGTPDAAVLGLEDGASQTMEIGGLMYGEIAGGRISEFWAYFDLSAYADLVGLMSGTAQATPEETSEHGAESSEHGHGEIATTGSLEADAEEIAVILTEFSITIAPTALRVGQPYAFLVTNGGTVTHEFVVERPGATHEPLVDGDQMAMVTGIAPGETRALGWTFTEAGSYQLACHEPGHYEAGQMLMVDVTG
jgi:uncharacterized cupredoxin-like copper-binding protein/predicted ester cyclase